MTLLILCAVFLKEVRSSNENEAIYAALFPRPASILYGKLLFMYASRTLPAFNDHGINVLLTNIARISDFDTSNENFHYKWITLP